MQDQKRGVAIVAMPRFLILQTDKIFSIICHNYRLSASFLWQLALPSCQSAFQCEIPLLSVYDR